MVGTVAWRWRRGIPLLTVLSLAAACSGTTPETTVPSTTVASIVTDAPTTTAPPATTLPTTSTTTTSTTTTTTIALISDPIEGVPDELVALIGAPMPEFDRTIAANDDGTANVEDIQRWLDEWDAWQVWVNANLPSITAETFAYGYVPGSMFDVILDAAEDPSGALVLSDLFAFTPIDDTSDTGDGYQTGRSIVITAHLEVIHSFVIEAGRVRSEEGPHRNPPDFAVRLLGSTDSDNVIWRMHVMESL